MKLTPKQFTAFAQSVLKREKRQSVRLINPKRDWFIGLGIGLLLLICVVSWSAYIYISNRFITEQSTAGEATLVPMYRAAAVAEALEQFSIKQETFDQLLNVTVPIAPAAVEEEAQVSDVDDNTADVIESQLGTGTESEESIESEIASSSEPNASDFVQPELSL